MEFSSFPGADYRPRKIHRSLWIAALALGVTLNVGMPGAAEPAPPGITGAVPPPASTPEKPAPVPDPVKPAPVKPAPVPAKPAPAVHPPAAAVAPAKPAPVAPKPPPVPEGMRSYDDVIKNAKEQSGLFTIYQNERGELFLALAPEQLDHDYILSTAAASGLGVDGVYSGVNLDSILVRFHRVNGQLQLIERNLNFRATPDTPEEIAEQRSFSDSILAGLKIEAVEPTKKWLLVNVSGLFLSDLPALGPALTSGMGAAYSLDVSRSYFTSVKSLPANLEIESADNFAAAHPSNSSALPDGRSLVIRVHYSLNEVPGETGYIPRIADTRVGYFVTAYKDLSNDSTRDPFVRYIDRWDIRKLHPERPLSLPVKPIVYWLDDAVPIKYRPAITEGILRWNKAFQKIGIMDAIQVKQRPSDADWDISDSRYNVVRWFNADEGAPAIGMHRVNPYTGQIIGATIVINDGFARYWKSYYHDYVTQLVEGQPFAPPGPPPSVLSNESQYCDIAEEAIPYFAQAMTASTLLTPEPGGEVPEKIVDQYLSSIVCHEVGHTLGLRHNFKGSDMLPYDELFDTTITHRLGTTGSVMDYVSPLIALPGQKQGDFYPVTIGPYDIWAIQYGYEPLERSADGKTRTTAEINRDLAAIASRSAEPHLQYATDEDATSVDPTVARWDYGREPMDGSAHNIALAHELFKRITHRLPLPGHSYDDAYEAYVTTMGLYIGAFTTPLRTIGGSSLHRDHAGQPGGRPPVQTVPAATQIRALQMITRNLFDDSALHIPQALLDRALPDRWMHWDSTPFGATYNPISIRAVLLNAQRSALDILYSPTVLQQLADQNLYAKGKGERMDAAHLIDGTTWVCWEELTRPGKVDISPLRRATERLQLDALIRLVVNPPGGTPEDASALARYELNWFRDLSRKSLSRGTSSLVVKAHLEDVVARISRALDAQMLTQG